MHSSTPKMHSYEAPFTAGGTVAVYHALRLSQHARHGVNESFVHGTQSEMVSALSDSSLNTPGTNHC